MIGIIHTRYTINFWRRYFRYKFLAITSTALLVIMLIKLSQIGNSVVKTNQPFHKSKLKVTTLRTPVYINPERQRQALLNKRNNTLMMEINRQDMIRKWWNEKLQTFSKKATKPKVEYFKLPEPVGPNYNVHIFYYAWYENEKFDGAWQHWNHKYLNNWNKRDPKVYPTGQHVPPDDIGSNFYPQMGCYSSRDPDVIHTHMKQIKSVGIGVLVVSWYPPHMSDGPSRSPDQIFSTILDVASHHQLKVAPHIEPYEHRNPENFRSHLKYFENSYGNHPSLYKMNRGGRNLTVYYVYDSYRTPALAWREMLSTYGNMTVRGTVDDGIFLGLLVNTEDRFNIRRARFDGFYTYFATNGFTYGSSWKNWKNLAAFAKTANIMFVPSVGPGYIDTRIRPWNGANIRDRNGGKYYGVAWRAALLTGAKQVSITSFNEWHEGTQIEPAVPKRTKDFTYLDYEPEGPDLYLNLTRFWINKFTTNSSDVPIL